MKMIILLATLVLNFGLSAQVGPDLDDALERLQEYSKEEMTLHAYMAKEQIVAFAEACGKENLEVIDNSRVIIPGSNTLTVSLLCRPSVPNQDSVALDASFEVAFGAMMKPFVSLTSFDFYGAAGWGIGNGVSLGNK